MQWVRQYLSGILSCSNLVSHSTSTAMSKFPYGSSSGKPFVMDGLTNSGVYSVWCCDGGRRDAYHDDYCLWVLADSSYPDFDFEMAGYFSKNPFDWYYLHMNWGNNGVNNGWYRDDNYSSTTTRRAVYIN